MEIKTSMFIKIFVLRNIHREDNVSEQYLLIKPKGSEGQSPLLKTT